MKKKFSASQTTTTAVGAGDIAAEPEIEKHTGLLSWISGAWKWYSIVTSWSATPSDDNIPTEKLVKAAIDSASARLIKYQIPADGVANESTGEITGTSTFNLPSDYGEAVFVQDGSMLAQFTVNASTNPKTITFNLVPLSGTCYLFYYKA